MATYVNNLRLKEIATGDESGTWGTSTNTNLELIGQALGYGTRAIANASTDNITIADGTSDADRSMYLKLTGGGQACTVTLLPNTASKVWIMENATSYTLTFTCGSGANVAILAGEVKIIATDGLGGGGVVYDLLTDVNLAGTTKTAGLTNAGALSNQGTVTVGVDDTGYDVKLFGATASAYLLWDESADKLLTAGGALVDIVKDKFMIGGTAVTTTAAELNVLDAVTAGTVSASLGVVVDSNKDIGSFRNITLTGELDAGSLDVSGNADIDGTLETDALSIDGTTITATAAELNYVDGVTSAIQTQIDTKTSTGKAIAMAMVFG